MFDVEQPISYKNLKYRDRLFIDCYLNETLKEPTTNMNTYNNKLLSYVFSFNKEQDLQECTRTTFMIYDFKKETWIATMQYIEGCKITIQITNAKKYMSLVSNATKVYNRCNRAINDIRTLMYDSDDKSKVLELKDAIYNSSIHAEDFKDRNDNRKMAMKIFGLDQVKVDVGLDMYEASGKNIFQSINSKVDMNREDAPIIPDVLEEIKDEDNE